MYINTTTTTGYRQTGHPATPKLQTSNFQLQTSNFKLKPLQPMPIQHHISHSIIIRDRTLIYVEPLVADFIVVIFTPKCHLISLDLYKSLQTATVPDIKCTGSVAEYLDRIFA
jgi:hypothetical protein